MKGRTISGFAEMAVPVKCDAGFKQRANVFSVVSTRVPLRETSI